MLKLRYLLEYAVLRLLWALLAVVPPHRAYAAGAAMGGLWYRCSRRRRRVALDNILKAGVAATPAEAGRIAAASFRHFTGHLLENLKAPSVLNATNWEAHVSFEGPRETLDLLRRGERPLILATAHLGCWEIAGYWVSLLRPVYALARPMNNPYSQRFLMRRHFRTDITLLPKDEAFSTDFMREWERKRAALAIVMDQHAGRSGKWMRVLGRLASVHTSPARLHLRTGFPLLFGCLIRTGPLKYQMVADAPVSIVATGSREDDTLAVLQRLNGFYEQVVRRYPEQYLWMHRRWRQPPAPHNATFHPVNPVNPVAPKQTNPVLGKGDRQD